MVAEFFKAGGIPSGDGASTVTSYAKSGYSLVAIGPIVQVTVLPTTASEPTVGLVPTPLVGPMYVRPGGMTSVTTTCVASAGP